MRRTTRRGAQAVEFALVLPVFLGLIAGIVDYGWYFYQTSVTMAVVRDATRRGSLTDAQTAQAQACSGLQSNGLTSGNSATCSEVTVQVTGTTPDEILTVSATVPYRPLFGLVPTPSRISSNLAMHLEP